MEKQKRKLMQCISSPVNKKAKIDFEAICTASDHQDCDVYKSRKSRYGSEDEEKDRQQAIQHIKKLETYLKRKVEKYPKKRLYVPFKENNEWEGETWTFWLQVNGNEHALALFAWAIMTAQEERSRLVDPYTISLKQVEKEKVVVKLCDYADSGYMSAHQLCRGKFTAPDVLPDPTTGYLPEKIQQLFVDDDVHVFNHDYGMYFESLDWHFLYKGRICNYFSE